MKQLKKRPTKNTKKLSRTKRVARWLDDNLLFSLSLCLLVFIPLFPKVPFFSPIEKYIVRVRVEDLLVLATIIVWTIQLWKKKISLKTPLTQWIGSYVAVAGISLLLAVSFNHTIPLFPDHLLKSVLHFFRYIEYFSLFFIVFSAITQRRQIKIMLATIISTLLVVGIYGYGQKYLYWPVYSTMNREFSKGLRLYLTPHARVSSTFAGHYDLAAYLVILLPLILALALQVTNWKKKLGLWLAELIGMWLLIMSASRTSFAAFGVGMMIVIFLTSLQYKKFWQKARYFLSRLAGTSFFLLVLLILFGGDITTRYTQVFEKVPVVSGVYQSVNTYSTQLASLLKLDDSPLAQLSQSPFGSPPPNSISSEDAAVLTPTDQQPVASLPPDVYEDIPDIKRVATISADGTTSIIEIETPRVWSENADKYGLSMAIRLDTLWPQAVNGFIAHPLFGSGYATLNKQELTEFTIAESTDNNYLRTLGETGLLGFVAFYGTIIIAIIHAVESVSSKDRLLRIIAIGYIGGTVSLLLNAVYIDVFAASKVAFTFWSITGLFMATYSLKNKNTQKDIL